MNHARVCSIPNYRVSYATLHIRIAHIRQTMTSRHARASYSVQYLDHTAILHCQHQLSRFLCAPPLVFLSNAPSVVHVDKWTNTRVSLFKQTKTKISSTTTRTARIVDGHCIVPNPPLGTLLQPAPNDKLVIVSPIRGVDTTRSHQITFPVIVPHSPTSVHTLPYLNTDH